MPVIDRIRRFFMRSTSVIEPAESDRRVVAPEPAEARPEAENEQPAEQQ